MAEGPEENEEELEEGQDEEEPSEPRESLKEKYDRARQAIETAKRARAQASKIAQATRAAADALKKAAARAALAAGRAIAVLFANPTTWIVLGIILIVILLTVLLIQCRVGGRSNTDALHLTRDNKAVKEILAYTNNPDALAELILDQSEEAKKQLKDYYGANTKTEVKQKLDKILLKIDEVSALRGGSSAAIRKSKGNELAQLIKELNELVPLPTSKEADLSRISSAPVKKIKVVKNERRVYFLDERGEKLGNAPANFGDSEGRPTPTGNFSITQKLQCYENCESQGIGQGPYITSTNYSNAKLGHEWMQFNGPYGFHGAADDNDKLNATWGCVRMYNADIKAAYPYIALDTPVEIIN